MKNYQRIISYFSGLFIFTIAIGLSIRANLGISPVSSVPYTLTVVWGIEIGIATIIFHIALIIIQILLLRKQFKIRNLLQVPMGIIFGAFTSFSVWLVSFLPPASNIIISLIYLALSIILVAIGELLYLPPNIVPLASSGFVQAISVVTGVEFEKIKVISDITMIVGSGVVCLIFIHNLGSVGIGTVISAALIGTTMGVIMKIFYKLTGIKINLKPGYEEK
ncbi:MAG: DUF6198 family protein [Methanobacteriaceae archaeon]|nr:DUF6198 family protein [Methanobacteriaceae archaeon]